MLKPSIFTATRSKQRGVSLIIAIMCVLMMALFSLAAIRSVDTGTLTLGNVSYKSSTQSGADEVTRQALAWLSSQAPSARFADSTANGYYAANKEIDAVDALSSATRIVPDWNGNSCSGLATFGTCLSTAASTALSDGTTGRWLIVRMCTGVGDPDGTTPPSCPRGIGSGTSGYTSVGSGGYSAPVATSGTSSTVYYRIIVRTSGVRTTNSYTETIVHM